MALQRCPNCGNPLTTDEYRAGICVGCKQSHTGHQPFALRMEMEGILHSKAPANQTSAGQKLTSGQLFMIVLAIGAVLFVIGSAVNGDPKSIRALARIGGTFAGFLVIAGIAGFCRMVGRLFSGSRR